MLSFALKIAWFSLSLSGLVACWVVLGIVAITSQSFWGPMLYTIGCTIVEVVFCIGMRWHMNPFLMPPGFCIAQTILISLGFFLVTGVASAFAYEYVFTEKERRIESNSVSLPWRPFFVIPVIIYPMSSSVAQILLVLLLDAVHPIDNLQCDASHPLWVRFIGYAGNPLAFSLAFFILSSLINLWFKHHTNLSQVTSPNLTALPPRKRGRDRRHQSSPRPFSLVIPTPSPLPSPAFARRVPISPGFASPVLSARQFHLPFTPLSPTVNDSEDESHNSPVFSRNNDYTSKSTHVQLEQNGLTQPNYDYEGSITGSVASSATPRFASPSPAFSLPLPPDLHTIRPKESNDFLKYLSQYKEHERRSGESDIEKVSRDAQRTQNTQSSATEWDDLSSLRWNRGDGNFETAEPTLDVDNWASSWTNGALRKFVGGQYNNRANVERFGCARGSADSGLKVTEDSESYYVTAEEGGSRAPNSRGYSSPENGELFRRDTTPRWRSKNEIEDFNSCTPSKAHSSKNSIVWRIIQVQLPITLVLFLATLSTLIDVIKQAVNPSSPSTTASFTPPTPFGTHHVAFLLLVWGPILTFGRLPAVRQKLFFFRKSRDLSIHAR
ncbi:hypothetical protein L218DRAFT_578048 [Marasmius fiardii PR-910]|nr:hypothetical protein L218DRAFT_578048 [Marasmius fiardii PR-910]